MFSFGQVNGQTGRRLAGVDLYSVWNRTLHITYEQRMDQGLSVILSTGYTFGRPFQGVPTSTNNTISGVFFKFGPRFRFINSNGEDRFFLGGGTMVNFFSHSADLELPGPQGPIVREFTITGTQAGLHANAGVTFLFFRIIQLDVGAEYGFLRPRVDLLSTRGYYQPGIGYADPRYTTDRLGQWQSSLTGIFTVSLLLKPGAPVRDEDVDF